MTIAHVTYRCDPGAFRGGVERVVLELANAQAAAGEDVEILTFSADRKPDICTAEGVFIRYFSGRRIAETVSSPQIAATLRAERSKYSVVHCHSTFHPLNVEARRAAAALSLPLFIHPHGALDPKLLRGLTVQKLKKRAYIRLIESRNLNSARAVFALSDEEAEQARSVGIVSPIEVVPNGIVIPNVGDAAARAAFRERHRIAADASVILYVGRIVPKKGIHDILSAIAEARKTAANLVLLLAGDPDQDPGYSASLRSLVQQHGMGEAVHWLGFVDEAEKSSLFAASDMFIHASYSEGMAMAILEGLAARLPTIVTKGCYMGRAAAAGAVVEAEQGPKAIAEAISSLVSDPQRRNEVADEGRQYVESNHSWPVLARQVLEAYKSYS